MDSLTLEPLSPLRSPGALRTWRETGISQFYDFGMTVFQIPTAAKPLSILHLWRAPSPGDCMIGIELRFEERELRSRGFAALSQLSILRLWPPELRIVSLQAPSALRAPPWGTSCLGEACVESIVMQQGCPLIDPTSDGVIGDLGLGLDLPFPSSTQKNLEKLLLFKASAIGLISSLQWRSSSSFLYG